MAENPPNVFGAFDVLTTEILLAVAPADLARLSNRELAAIGNRITYTIHNNKAIQEILRKEVSSTLEKLQVG